MKVDMSYAEMSFLRDLVGKEKMRMWKDKWARRIKKDATYEEIDKLIEKVFRPPPDWDRITSDEQCIGMLLERFRKLERELQRTLEYSGKSFEELTPMDKLKLGMRIRRSKGK